MSAGELCRTVRKAVAILLTILTGIPALRLFRSKRSKAEQRLARAEWMSWMSRRFLRCLDCKVSVEGSLPKHGLVVSNHLSYVDIIVIGSTGAAIFVSKSDVKSWPVFGLLTRLAGTIYVDREHRLAVRRCVDEMENALKTGLPLVIFPEGTSSGGESVLPFRSSLLGGAETGDWEISAAAIDYQMEDGDPSTEVCYWGDMVFGPHLLALLRRKGFQAMVSFGEPHPREGSRKELALRLHAEVSQRHSKLRGLAEIPGG